MVRLQYIDVSAHNGVIDFDKLKGHVDGVIIRAGFGNNAIDTQFVRNIEECNRLGIPCGVYWFSYALNEEAARNEARCCLEAIKGYKVELPVCFDLEYDTMRYAQTVGVTITKEMATAHVHAFCQAVEAAGYYAMNYTNYDYQQRYFDDSTRRYDLWLAVWPDKPNLNAPPECGIWQYGAGKFDGINGDVDADCAYKDYKKIIREWGLNHLPQEPSAEQPKEPEKPKVPGVGDAVKVKLNAPVNFMYEAPLTIKQIKNGNAFLAVGDQIVAITATGNIDLCD